MRLLIQRVSRAAVDIGGKRVAEGGLGLLVLVSFGMADGPDLPHSKIFRAMAEKMLGLRIFPGDTPETAEKMHRSVQDVGGDVLLVPQFTLYADCTRGRRPSFTPAAPPVLAQDFFQHFVALTENLAAGHVGSGVFGAEMRVSLENWGPVTIWLDSEQLFSSQGG